MTISKYDIRNKLKWNNIYLLHFKQINIFNKVLRAPKEHEVQDKDNYELYKIYKETLSRPSCFLGARRTLLNT